jgi:hypothetical protein
VEEEEREAEDADAQAARDRVEEEEALAAVHASQMQDLQGRLSAARRAKAQRRPLPPPAPPPRTPLASPLPLLTASRVARMDKRLPRPAVGSEGLQPAAPSPDVGREDACAGGCWERPRGTRLFPLVDGVYFSRFFCLLVNIGDACVEAWTRSVHCKVNLLQ